MIRQEILTRPARNRLLGARDVLRTSAANVAEEVGGVALRNEVGDMNLFDARRHIAAEHPGIESYLVVRGIEDLTGHPVGTPRAPFEQQQPDTQQELVGAGAPRKV